MIKTVLALLVLLAIPRWTDAYIPMTLPSTFRDGAGIVPWWNLAAQPGGAIPFFVNLTRPSGSGPIDPPGATREQIVAAVQAAFQAWASVSSSSLRFRFAGETTATNGPDLMNVVALAPARAKPR